jgi:phosphoglycerol transferase MdoB-like AlkP superfamily enzyme
MALVFLTISRVFMSIWHFNRVDNANGWIEIILSGLRIDIATLSYIFIIPALVTCLGINQKYFNRVWNFIIRAWVSLALWLLVFMEIVTPSFILEYDVRPNRLFVEYLIYPSELTKMLFSGYKIEILIALVVSLLTLYFAWKYSIIFTDK